MERLGDPDPIRNLNAQKEFLFSLDNKKLQQDHPPTPSQSPLYPSPRPKRVGTPKSGDSLVGIRRSSESLGSNFPSLTYGNVSDFPFLLEGNSDSSAGPYTNPSVDTKETRPRETPPPRTWVSEWERVWKKRSSPSDPVERRGDVLVSFWERRTL